jgi:Cu/Ag efflux protein CusF
MTLISSLTELVLALAISASPVTAQGSTTPKAKADPPVTINATVEAIDKGNRLVTLRGPKGNTVDIYVDQSHKRFDELKVGDKINATYYETMAVVVRKPGDPAPTSGITAAETPRGDGKPGQTLGRQITMSVTIMAIDPAVPSVTVKGENGNTISMRVQDPARLKGVKVGDTVDVTYTQALLVKMDQ